MADLAVSRQDLASATALTGVAASGGGDRFNPGSNRPVFVYAANGHGSAQSLTFDDPTSQSPTGAVAFNPDFTISVPAGTNRLIPIRNPDRFRDSNGYINLTYSGVTLLTVAVFT